MRCVLRPLAALMFALVAATGQTQTTVRMMAGQGYGIPPKESTISSVQVRRAVFEKFAKDNPDVRVVNAGGLELNNQLADSMFLMAMAGDRPPDLFYVNFRQYYTFLEQGFCRPLDDLVAQDPDVVSRVNPTVMKVLKSFDGHIYAVPFFQVAVALYFRKDFFLEAGLDPTKPPETWDDFYRACQRLTTADGSRKGFEFTYPAAYHWQNFLYEAGGEVVKPAENGFSRAAIATPQGALAIDFYRKLVLSTWRGADGTMRGPAAANSADLTEDVRTGKTAMWLGYTNDVVMNGADLPPSVVGIAALPAGPAGHKNEINAGMWAISARVKDPVKLRACWRFIKYFAGDEAARINTQRSVELGRGNLVNPTWLKKFGYNDILDTVDPSYVKANEELFTTGHPEPYGRNCQQVYSLLDMALDRARLEPNTPASTILIDVQRQMDEKLLGYTPPDVMARRRIWALGFLAGLCLLSIPIAIFALRRARRASADFVERLPAGLRRGPAYRFMAVCLSPAVLTILVWAYYPLFKGLIIAFQDYKIAKGATWVGLDNFIGVFTQPVFYQSLWNSVVYVALTIAIGFFIPIFLALALNEIPRFKVFFRTVFYLPAMTSSIVVALLWRQFYSKTDDGLLNSLLRPTLEHVLNPALRWIGHAPIPLAHDWLGDPGLAMFAVVLPGIWAGAGPGSILYLAALKNISTERYEAADIDGASWGQKIRYITLPGLKPLILINLLGVFIAGFKAMENIFVLTQGGPLNSTRTIGLEVWQNAFMYLKFGYATAAAWVMGAILIGFTLIQMRTLVNMRFTAAGGK